MQRSLRVLDAAHFDSLVGVEVIQLIKKHAPRKIMSRINKALDHYAKAEKLQGVDDEMGSIRLIAAEEELVVAIFEWLKLNAKFLPEHNDFIGKFKNHYVKLSFHPVLMQFRFILEATTQEGGEDMHDKDENPFVDLVVHDGKIRVRLSGRDHKSAMHFNPTDFFISHGEKDPADVVEMIFSDFKQLLYDQNKISLSEFITARAEFRNKILYSEDGGSVSMDETLKSLTETVFSKTIRDLLWAIAILLTNKPMAQNWGLISQFIAVYRKVLLECKLIKPEMAISEQ